MLPSRRPADNAGIRSDRQALFVVLLACAGFLVLAFVTVGPLGVGRPLELVQGADADGLPAAPLPKGVGGLELLVISSRLCGPCKRLELELAARGDSIPAKLTTSTDDDVVVERYRVRAYPTLILLRDGVEVARRTGYASAADLGKWVGSPDDAEAAHVLAKLTPAEADRLQGRRAKYLVQLDGPATAVGDRVVYEVVVAGEKDMGTVWLAEGQDAEVGMVVEARLVVLSRKAWVAPSGGQIPEFTEYRLMDSVRVGG